MPPYGGKYKAAPYGCGLFTVTTTGFANGGDFPIKG
jgi:hypothetical protein